MTQAHKYFTIILFIAALLLLTIFSVSTPALAVDTKTTRPITVGNIDWDQTPESVTCGWRKSTHQARCYGPGATLGDTWSLNIEGTKPNGSSFVSQEVRLANPYSTQWVDYGVPLSWCVTSIGQFDEQGFYSTWWSFDCG